MTHTKLQMDPNKIINIHKPVIVKVGPYSRKFGETEKYWISVRYSINADRI